MRGILKSDGMSFFQSVCNKSCLSQNLKTNERNLMNHHRKIKHNEKLLHPQEIGSHAQGQGNNRVKGQIMS